METVKNGSQSRAVLTQTKNNTTLWIGHLQNDMADHLAGQTFICPSDGELDNIQVYSSFVQRPGTITLTLHEFDTHSKTWKNAFASSAVFVTKNQESKWLSFSLQKTNLEKDKTYAFRLQSEDGMIGIGELVRGNQDPCFFGQEWNASSDNDGGTYFTWFSLAFKVEMVA